MNKTIEYMKLLGNIVDVIQQQIYKAELLISDDKILKINNIGEEDSSLNYFLPGFIDAHVHIESTMVTPVYFANHVKKFGTLGVVTDPHEISNVCGVDGFDYMYKEASKSPIGIFFGVPSCVPATPFETSGAEFSAKTINQIFEKYNVVALSEMMNFPGVVNKFEDVMEKIKVAKSFDKKIDGHSPGLQGNDLQKYIDAGITTDHEAFSYDEAKEKINKGMLIQIREGSAARNFEALHKLISEFPDKVMFCTDDAHPDTLIQGHIDRIVKLAIKKGHRIFDILKAASLNAINHYGLPVGILQEGDSADFIEVNNLNELIVKRSFFKGQIIFNHNQQIDYVKPDNRINQFSVDFIQLKDLRLTDKKKNIKVIEAIDGELITNSFEAKLPIVDGFIQSDKERDILKIIVVNRYKKDSKVQVGFIKGFNLKNAALAGSVAHDSHNIIAVGDNDKDIVNAVNTIIKTKGGICISHDNDIESIPLPVGGLMANETIENMAIKYKQLDQKVKYLGSKLQAPFMTLAFMSLLVIPSLKLGDQGLFDVNKFEFTSIYSE
jgi:adenine deaminase